MRDSYDLGANFVVASGAKLPPPVSINHLLSVFQGPVLICQGALDPLNNSTRRADILQTVREDITVDLLRLGHCPMDENAGMVADSIQTWRKKCVTV